MPITSGRPDADRRGAGRRGARRPSADRPAAHTERARSALALALAGLLAAAGCTTGPGAAAPSSTDPAHSTTAAPQPDTAAPQPDGARATRAAFLGDSLTEGVGAAPEQGFAWRLASKLEWEAAIVDGVSGSGYLASGAGRPLPERVWDIVRVDPDVVVVSGGNNDAFQGFAPQDVRPAAEQTFRALAAGLPDASIVVVGPFPTSPTALSAPDAMNQAVRAAARAAGVEYVDARQVVDHVPLSRVGDYLSADGLHPNEAGHEAIATELAEILDGE